MKTNIFIPFILIAAITFYGCSKKQAASESEKLPSPEEQAVSETESLSNPDSEFDNWSFEDAYALAVLMKHPNKTYDWASVGESPATVDLFIYYYMDIENNRYQNVFAPVIGNDFYDVQRQKLGKYAQVKREEFAKMDFKMYASPAASIIAFHEKDTPRNRITILFSPDKWNTWNESYIEIDANPLNDKIRVILSLTCPQGDTTGYLLVTLNENEQDNLNGGSLYRTKNLGKSWELASELPEDYNKHGALFVYGNTIIAPTTKTFASRKGRYFSFYKSTDAVTWKRIELPMTPEKYYGEWIDSMSFDGNYGFVDVRADLREEFYEDKKSVEHIFLVTRDRGETWALWNNNRNITVE